MAETTLVKISELDEATDLTGLYTLGTDANNKSVKVGLEFVKTAADSANDAAKDANTAADNIGAKVTQTDTGATVTVTDKDGTKTTAEITNGKDGADGADGSDGRDGADGFSPTVDVEETDGGHVVTITDANGSQSFEVADGGAAEFEEITDDEIDELLEKFTFVEIGEITPGEVAALFD